ncbi:MAG: antitoxin [Acidobacteria bacterium]|nr:antitoxin [Acidobacteriota bacterium]MYE44732.1 antitoxin [Acidobacteriota bacterium]
MLVVAVKRLHVVMSDEEYGDSRRVARGEGLSLSEWVRRTLRAATQTEAERIERKMRAIEAAAQWKAPTADPEQMLAEIEAGRRGVSRSSGPPR